MARTKGTTPSPQDVDRAVSPDAAEGYTVIARRYRPQRFEDVVGQEHVVESLRNAIRMNRVTHAYVFAGTRGVGKTSIARIFAKCLNCVEGPTETPCLKCDICRLIALGQDMDVIEIDGASNNGVEAVRELRQNAGLRPSRARYKIYYIDEVHMLSTGAFNALLKTLEEPPPHVKFFFATTEPNKIPITVLSRCQRYDFAGMTPEQVVETLAEICRREGVDAEPEALRAVARRAGGSMRDAQSLLEQLLSGGGEALTVEAVHRRLGTASDERLLDLIDALASRDAPAALRQLDASVNEGVQPTDVLNGLLEFLRDLMVLAAGSDGILLAATPRQKPRLASVAERWSLETILAALQILAEARGRMRGSPHGRLLVELALVRVATLEGLGTLSDLIGRLAALEAGSTPAHPLKKKGIPEPGPVAPPNDRGAVERTTAVATSRRPPGDVPAREEPEPGPAPPLEPDAVRKIWPELIRKVGMRLGFPLSQAERFLAISGPNDLAFRLPPGYDGVIRECATPEAMLKIREALSALLRRPIRVQFEESGEQAEGPSTSVANAGKGRDQLETDPMVRKVVELFEARPLHLEYDEEA